MGIYICPAREEDAKQITAMVNRFAAENIMLPRSEENVRQTIPDWLVAIEFDESAHNGQTTAKTTKANSTANNDETRNNLEWSTAQTDASYNDRYSMNRTQNVADATTEELFPNRNGKRVVGCGAIVPLTDTLVEIRSLAIDNSQQGKGLGSQLVIELLELAREREFQQVCALTLRPNFFTHLGFSLVDRWSISPKVWQACIYCPKFHRCDEVAVLMDLNTASTSMINKERNRQPGWNHLLKWKQWQPLRLAYQYQDKEKLVQ